MAVTGVTKETSRSKLYKELGLESLKSQRTLRRLCTFHKIVSARFPTYLFTLIPQSAYAYQTRTSINIPTCQCRTDTFKYSVFPWTVVEWNKIHPDIKNASIAVFKKQLLKEIRPDSHPIYNICKPIGLKLLTGFKLGLSHLSKHIFNHNYENYINPFCTCSLQAEKTSHFFLYYHYYHSNRLTLFNELCEIDMNLPNLSEEKLLNIILCGSCYSSDTQNQSILNSTIKYIRDSNHFCGSIF